MVDSSRKLRAVELTKAIGAKDLSIVSQASRRGNLIYTENQDGKKMYDINLAHNRDWIEAYCDKKGTTFSLARAYEVDLSKRANGLSAIGKKKLMQVPVTRNAQSPPPPPYDYGENNEGEPDEQIKETLTERKNRLQGDKLEKENVKLDLQNAKISGELIPYEEASHIMNYVVSNFTAMGSAHFENTLGRVIKELGGTIDDYRSEMERFRVELVAFSTNALKELDEGLDGVVDEYMEVRGRGERK